MLPCSSKCIILGLKYIFNLMCRYLSTNFPRVLEITGDIKESGNVYYRAGDHVTATRKYRKCCKYIKLLRDTMGQTDDEEEKL